MLFCFRVQKNKRMVRSRRGNPPLVALSSATKTRIHPVGVVHERCAERRKIWGPGEHSLVFDAYGDRLWRAEQSFE